MKKQLLTAAAVFMSCYGFSQNLSNINWVFGDSCGLNFSGGDPEFFETSIISYEAVASVSDTDGNLLFYTNGQHVWDRENNLMPNGDSLLIGAVSFAGSSLTQGVIIIPKPESNDYFILYVSQSSGLYYSILDMDLNDGLGDVGSKNIILLSDTALTEKMQAVKHANGRDWWLILRAYPNFDSGDSLYFFLSYLITPLGISSAMTQTYGDVYEVGNSGGQGQMKFNKQGNIVVLTRGNNIDLYDFDRCTGEFSNFRTINNVTEYFTYGCEFSPDGTKLYVGTFGPSLQQTVLQYCFDCGLPTDETVEIIYKNMFNGYSIAQFQLASNDKLYISFCKDDLDHTVWSNEIENLSVINSPNEEGAFCNFDTLTISLNGHRVWAGLPNIPNYNLGPLLGSGCDTLTAINAPALTKNTISLYPNPAKETIFITSHFVNYTNTSLQIFAVTGEKLKEERITAPSQKINIAALPLGMYIVVMRNENGWIGSQKLIIKH